MTLQIETVSYYQSRSGYLITSDHKGDCATEAERVRNCKDNIGNEKVIDTDKQGIKCMGLSELSKKVSKGAKIRNRYNQVPHLTQDTNGKVTNSQKTPQTRAKRSALSQQVTTKHI